MNTEIKEIFKNSLNPRPEIRSASEKKLSVLQKDYNFLLSLPYSLMKDSDIIIKKTSSIFFKNAVINEWNYKEFEETKKILILKLLEFFTRADEVNIVAFNGILVHFLNNEPVEETNKFITTSALMIKSNDMLQFKIGLEVLLQIWNADKIKYQLENILQIIYKTSGQELMSSLHVLINKKEYKLSYEILKFIAKSYNYYSIPDFLVRIDVFSYTVNLVLQILKIENCSDICTMLCKKWAAIFLYKACNKSIKKFYKNSELSDFIVDNTRFEYIYNVFLYQLKMDCSDSFSISLQTSTVEFLTLCASDKNAYKFMEKDIIFLISEYILPLHNLSENEEDDFENDPEKYLREKYHFFSNNLRNESGTLFCEIVKNLKHNTQGMNWLYQFLFQKLNTYKNNQTPENAKITYGIYFLISNITHSLFKFSKKEFERILNEYVFYDLKNSSIILKSQACYLLSYIEENITFDRNIVEALDATVCLIRERHPILSVDSTLAMNFFISIPDIKIYFKKYIGEVIQSILTLSGSYDIEPLTYLLDNIMETFLNEVTEFAPSLVSSLGNLILSHLTSDQSESEDRIMVVSGFLRSVETIVSSVDKSKVLFRDLYQNFYNVLYYIFSERKDNFYQEALDITNNFLYSFDSIDTSMWHLLSLIIGLPKDDIVLYPTEISEIIDNLVCSGKDTVLDNNIYLKLLSIIKIYCTEIEDTIYDDDFIAGCSVIETLLLNVGDKLFSTYPDNLDIFIKIITENIVKLEDDSTAIVYGLEVIMNCFYLRPLETLHLLKLYQFSDIFFNFIYKKRKEFCRVHDKKICVRFIGRLLSLNQADINNLIDYKKLSKFFTSVFCSLPAAIEARNKLIDSKDDKKDVSDEYNDEASEEEYNDLEEDIYFTTILDNFDPYSYIFNILSNNTNGKVAELIMSSLNKEQYEAINEVFVNKSQVQQKKLNQS